MARHFMVSMPMICVVDIKQRSKVSSVVVEEQEPKESSNDSKAAAKDAKLLKVDIDINLSLFHSTLFAQSFLFQPLKPQFITGN